MRRPTRAVGLLATLVLVACQGGATTQPSQSAAATAQTSQAAATSAASAPAASAPAASATLPPETSLTMWGYPQAMLNFAETSGNANLIAAVKSDLNIDLNISAVAQNDLGAKLKAALPAGTGPDVVLTDFDVMNPYWQFTEPLDSYATADWGPDWRTKFTDSATTEMDLVGNIANEPGKSLYLPGNMQLVGWVVYSQKLFAQVGLDPKTLKTFDDFISACGKIKAAGLTPVEVGNHPALMVDHYQTFVENAAPGQMELAERGKAKFTDPDMVKAFDLVAQFFNDCAEPGALGTDVTAVFPAFFKLPQTAAMSTNFGGTGWFSFGQSQDAATAQIMHTDLSAFAFPGSKGLVSTDGGVAMLSSSKNKDAAWRLIKWFVSGQGAEHTAKVQGQPMAWKAIPYTPTGTAFDQNLAEPMIAGLQDGSQNKFRRILCADVYTALTTAVPGVITGQITAAAAAQQVQSAFDSGCQKWVQP